MNLGPSNTKPAPQTRRNLYEARLLLLFSLHLGLPDVVVLWLYTFCLLTSMLALLARKHRGIMPQLGKPPGCGRRKANWEARKVSNSELGVSHRQGQRAGARSGGPLVRRLVPLVCQCDAITLLGV
jgi:hypothetical protein